MKSKLSPSWRLCWRGCDKEESMKRNVILILLILFFLGLMLFSGYRIVSILSEYRAGTETYEDIRRYVSTVPAIPVEPKPEPEQTLPQETEPVDDTVYPVVDFDGLLTVCEDVVGWLYIEGTNVDYPVVQGVDNNQYLRHMMDGRYNTAGTLFVDYRNEPDFTERNTIIYGHNMRNGTMFAALGGYRKQEFYDEHPVALLMTPQGNYRLEIFSAYVADVEQNAWDCGFASDAEFARWLEEVAAKSEFQTDLTPTAQDRIVTLSTCSKDFNNARFVVHCILK